MTAQAAIEHMKRENKRAIGSMHKEEAEGHTCGAPHRSLMFGIERTLSNQELAAENWEEVKTSLNDLKSAKCGKKHFKLWGLEMDGFDWRDILRIVAGLAIIWLILERHGLIKTDGAPSYPGQAAASEVVP